MFSGNESAKGGYLEKWSRNAHHVATTTATTQHSAPVVEQL
jgi:hypothetical protein